MPDQIQPTAPLAPDFAPHPPGPGLTGCTVAQNWVHFTWEDGLTWRAFGTFLRENEVVDGIVSDLTREREVEIDRLPSGIPESAEIDPFGNVAIRWTGGHESHYSGGWIRDMAEGRWSPDADLPKIVPWTTKDLSEPPSFSGPEMFRDATEMEAFLTACWRSGLARLRGLPSKDGTVQRVAEAIGTVRNSNFGFLFSVETKPDPDSNAYRAVSLDAHTDLATRETQPGFQLLHCQENSSTGGESTMVDGFAVAQAIRADDQDAYNALADLKWVFTNRHRDTDYRWSGPIIETSSSGDPIEIRNTGFLRFFPDMAEADIPRAYAALTKFTALCSDTHFQMATPFTAGDLVMFDNRRVLHGRNGFDRQSGIRRLQGCYLDRDEVASRLRVLARSRRAG